MLEIEFTRFCVFLSLKTNRGSSWISILVLLSKAILVLRRFVLTLLVAILCSTRMACSQRAETQGRENPAKRMHTTVHVALQELAWTSPLRALAFLPCELRACA